LKKEKAGKVSQLHLDLFATSPYTKRKETRTMD
jgi:hypothetical protein